MTPAQMATLFGFGLLLFLGPLWIARAAHRSQTRGRHFRRDLLEQIRPLRLHRMLRHRGIDLARYLHGERVLDIRRNIENCRRCESLAECDTVLESTGPAVSDFSFCPNCEHLARIRAEQRAAGVLEPV